MLRHAKVRRSATRLVLALGALLVIVALALAPRTAGAALGDCSQPSSSGSKPTASDCLYILNVAVGLLTCSPECICAPKGSLPPAATDALVCLQVAVNQPVALDCPCQSTTTTPSTTLPSTTVTSTTSSTTTTSASLTTTTLLQCPVQLTTPADTSLLACACVSDFGPACNGTCPADAACIPDFDTQECFCQGFGCGDYMGAPVCYGLCGQGAECVFTGDSCACAPAQGFPCTNGTVPDCDGDCPQGQFCMAQGDSCSCVDVTCGSYAAAPLCLGTCPTGLTCVDVEGVCSCLSN